MGTVRGVVVRAVARLAALGWFRTVERTGTERVPAEDPLIVVANHGGGFVDPALLTAALPRFPRFLAMATLWRTPARPFLWLAGAIPVYRAVDGGTGSNRRTFEACHDVLADEGVIGIFPEGQASDEPHLLPVKTGTARIAVGARAQGAEGLRILPVGLIYEDKARARAGAYVRIGEPLDLDAWIERTFPDRVPRAHVVDEDDHEVVRALTEEIREGLASVALNFDDAAQSAALARAAEIALRPLDADPGWSPALDDREDLASRIAAAPAEREEAVVTATTAYVASLEANGVTDRAVAADPARHRRVHLIGGLAALAVVPLAILGAVVNAVPALLTWAVGRPAMAPVTRATVKFLVALVTFPATWLIWRYTALDGRPHPWLLTIGLGPICGLAGSWLLGRAERGRRARLSVRELAGVQASLAALRVRRAAVVEAVDRSLVDPGPPGRPGSWMHRRW